MGGKIYKCYATQSSEFSRIQRNTDLLEEGTATSYIVMQPYHLLPSLPKNSAEAHVAQAGW